MRFQTQLEPAVLIRRYKRFLADCRLADGRDVVAHVANPGAMSGLAEPGMRVWLEPNDDPKKKLDWGWRVVELAGGARVCVDTGLTNRVVRDAIEAGALRFEGYDTLRAEVAYGEKSRVDFLLTGPAGRLWLEVKSVSLSRQAGLAEFPDTATARGARHLAELAGCVARGDRAMLLYVVMCDDCDQMALAADLDPTYARGAHMAARQGVESCAYGTVIDTGGVTLGERLPLGLAFPPEQS